MRRVLVLGGVRSGKSRLAERLACDSGRPVTYVATAEARDDEMRRRIAAHRARRPADWELIEEPIELSRVIHEHAGARRLLLIDCLSIWLTNLLCHPDGGRLERERDLFVEALSACAGTMLLVSSEGSMGLVPATELARRYCDEAGLLHQDVAERCDTVVLTVAGLPHLLKGNLP